MRSTGTVAIAALYIALIAVRSWGAADQRSHFGDAPCHVDTTLRLHVDVPQLEILQARLV